MASINVQEPPTPFALIISTAIICGLTGYMLGLGSSIGFLPNPFSTNSGRKGSGWVDSEVESAEEDIDDDLLDHAPRWDGESPGQGSLATKNQVKQVKPKKSAQKPAQQDKPVADESKEFENNKEECKLVLVVRTDLGMTKGTPHNQRPAMQS